MQIQLAGGTQASGSTNQSGAFNERIFRIARNSYTKTATASTFVRGNPAVLASESASVNGYDVKHPDTMGQDYNNLLIGVVYDYPDTSASRNGNWNPEDVGLVQCYGLNTNVIALVASTTIAAGLMLSPDTGSQFKTMQAIVAGSATVASSAIFTQLSGVGGLVILAQTVASQASGTKAVTAFIRCM